MTIPFLKKDDLRSLGISFAVFIVALIVYVGWLEGLESRLSIDWRFYLRGERTPHQGVVIIGADEKSMEKLGRWPWNREVHARLIDWLTAAGAKAIAFDVLFTEEDQCGRVWSDTRMAQAAARSGRVVLGTLFYYDAEGRPTNPLLPIPVLRDERIHLGSVNIFPENDGISRMLPTWMEYEGKKYASLSLAAFALAQDKTVDQVLEELQLPVDDSAFHEVLLNYAGDFEHFPYHSFGDVVEGKVPPEAFKDKIVLVGGTAVGLFDFKAVPNVKLYPGVEIHATALDNYFNRSFLKRVSGQLETSLLALLFALLCGLLAARVPTWAGLISTGLLLGYFLLCQWLFVKKNLVLSYLGPAFSMLLSYLAVFFYRFVTENRQKRWYKSTFSQYMSPKVVEAIAANPGLLKLGGEDREITVFFSDLVGFTSISESMKPSQLVAVLNEYLTEMSDIVLKHDGVVDKYIGDAIMAFWNAPVDQPRHAALACFTALDQLERLKHLQKSFAERKLPPIDCRIGVNTGHVVVGNMGSHTRFDYTVMGDTVNLASRLEGANKPFHTHVMISEFTHAQVKNDVEVRELDLVGVQGKAKPVRVYELAGRAGELTAGQKAGFGLYQEGLDFYRDRKFQKAAEKFKKVLESLPDDGPSQAYLLRCDAYVANPPEKNWDGVFRVSK